MQKILIKKPMKYDEDLLPIINQGVYDFDPTPGPTGWPMIRVNDFWWDWAADEDDQYWELV